MWTTLIITLPTQPNAVRVRVWRALKALGCAALRDGAYLLPANHDALFEPLAEEVRVHGGSAVLLSLTARNPVQHDELLALFDRAEAYALWRDSANTLLTALPSVREAEARRRWRSVNDALQTIQHTDYHPGPAAAQAQQAASALRQALDAVFAAGEPQAVAEHGLVLCKLKNFQAKRWATRARPWADRLACAWLIGRFIDPQARFVWLAETGGAMQTPRGAIGFDYDGARFTHVGARVTFEVMLARFGLDQDPALQRLAETVHYLDVGGIPAAEAAGLESVLAGLRTLHADDDDLLAAASAVFNALYAAKDQVARHAA